MALTEEQIFEHLAAIQIACDPKSPFYGMINFTDGLLALPIPEQQQVYDRMDSGLKTLLKEASEAQHGEQSFTS